MKYIEYRDNQVSFRALTGLSTQQFTELLPYFDQAHNDYLSKYEMNGKLRNNFRRFIIYSNSPLPTVVDRLFFYVGLSEE